MSTHHSYHGNYKEQSYYCLPSASRKSSSPNSHSSKSSTGRAMNGRHSNKAVYDVNMDAASPEVIEALKFAREDPAGERDPYTMGILEAALDRIWSKVEANPHTYVMTPREFSLFNFFQYRFTGNQTAIAARRRYWDSFE